MANICAGPINADHINDTRLWTSVQHRPQKAFCLLTLLPRRLWQHPGSRLGVHGWTKWTKMDVWNSDGFAHSRLAWSSQVNEWEGTLAQTYKCGNKGALSLQHHWWCERCESVIAVINLSPAAAADLSSCTCCAPFYSDSDSDLLPATICRTDHIPRQCLRASTDRCSLSLHLLPHIHLSVRFAFESDMDHLSCLCPFPISTDILMGFDNMDKRNPQECLYYVCLYI